MPPRKRAAAPRPRGVWATTEAVEEVSRTWTEAQKKCRIGRNHAWEWQSAQYLRRARVYIVTQQCERGCGVTRWNEMDTAGYLLGGWRTHYPKEYPMPKGQGRVGVDGQALLRIDHVLQRVHVEQVDDE